jgi:PST family polysaccharide transporter
LIIGVFGAISVGTFALAGPLVTILYGRGLAETVILVRILSVSIFFVAAGTCYATLYMLAFGHARAWSRIIMSAGVIDLAALVALSRFFPVDRSVALTTVVVEGYVLIRTYTFYRRRSTRHAKV